MRIHNRNITVRQIVFSKTATLFYFILFTFFSYKSLGLLPIWLKTRENLSEVQAEYLSKQNASKINQSKSQDSETEIGQERYKKDFFNKLDEGEKLIILYGEEKVQQKDETMKERKMYWWEEVEQDFFVWWRNLDIKK